MDDDKKVEIGENARERVLQKHELDHCCQLTASRIADATVEEMRVWLTQTTQSLDVEYLDISLPDEEASYEGEVRPYAIIPMEQWDAFKKRLLGSDNRD